MKILVTAGGTREYIDPVRYITNASTGKMGYAVAQAAIEKGHSVTLITAPSYIAYPRGASIVKVVTSEDMFSAVKARFNDYDCLIMCAAVSDYTPVKTYGTKIKKKDQEMTITLKPTHDIIKWAGENKREGQIIIGFALEDTDILQNAQEKMQKKKMDVIVANQPNAISGDKSEVYIKIDGQDWIKFPERHKSETASELIKIADKIFNQSAK